MTPRSEGQKPEKTLQFVLGLEENWGFQSNGPNQIPEEIYSKELAHTVVKSETYRVGWKLRKVLTLQSQGKISSRENLSLALQAI